jgi:hypothetical protein
MGCTSSNGDIINRSVANNFANREASKMSSLFEKIKVSL